MKILVDVNVFIDVMTKRTSWEGSVRVLNLVRKSREVEGWTSALTVMSSGAGGKISSRRAESASALGPRSCQLLDQRLGLLQVGRIKALGEPAVDLRQ